ncbi:hypothetical protein [Ruegeria sp.]|uniref:hypothetical protein n=1 Tax=Ruegeria sp. TaxID=1879320 RepID=UPI003C7B5989
MSKSKMSDFSIFAMNFLKLAQDRKLMNRFDRQELESKIKALPKFKVMIADPKLCDDLSIEYSRWKSSKNLFVLMSLLREISQHNMENAPAGGAADSEEIDESAVEEYDEEEADEEDENSSQQIMAGLKKYEDLLAERVNMRAFRQWILRVKFIGRAGGWLQELLQSVQLKLYLFRNAVKDYKDKVDNAAYTVFERAIDGLPNGPRKSLMLLLAWLVLKVVGVILFALLIFSRPTILLEKLGIDGETLPLPGE